MSDTELIATKLLGWEDASAIGKKSGYYKRPDGELFHCDAIKNPRSQAWPDFTTLDGCRLFERSLANALHFSSYAHALWSEVADQFINPDTALDTYPNPVAVSRVCIFATPAQRVAACVRVIVEAGL
jgi:hypothetical protein